LHLVQILLPLFDNAGKAFPDRKYRDVTHELTDRFGGVTAYTRAPAEGRWQDDADRVRHDDIVVLDTMVERLDRSWWAAYRVALQATFEQDEIVVRAMPIEKL
jgi:hypothetical protein